MDTNKNSVSTTDSFTKERLEYLRGELRAERISLGELDELRSIVAYIEPGDVELLEPAGVPEEHQDAVLEIIKKASDLNLSVKDVATEFDIKGERLEGKDMLDLTVMLLEEGEIDFIPCRDVNYIVGRLENYAKHR